MRSEIEKTQIFSLYTLRKLSDVEVKMVTIAEYDKIAGKI